MEKQDNILARATHIKHNTEGTSNEISLSVLDAVSRVREDRKETVKDPRHVSLFTIRRRKKSAPAVAKSHQGGSSGGTPLSSSGKTHQATPVFRVLLEGHSPSFVEGSVATRKLFFSRKKASVRTPADEILYRKTRRRFRRIAGATLAACLIVGMVGAGIFSLYRDIRYQGMYQGELRDALAKMEETDKILGDLDKTIQNPFSPESQALLDQLPESLKKIESSLDHADAKARDASLQLHRSKEKDVANQAVTSIAARRKLMQTGNELLPKIHKAQQLDTQLSEAWQLVLQADSESRSAAKIIQDASDEHIKESKNKSNNAKKLFETARNKFLREDLSDTNIDISKIITYIDKRIEASGYALASDEALLAKNKEDATSQNNAYNKTDVEAAHLAKELPSTPSDLVYASYHKNNEALEQSYSTARLQAVAADAFIRDYLGTGTK